MKTIAPSNRDLLKSVLPEYQRISEAPTEFEDVLHERRKLYKAIDSVGNVYLIQNPASFEEIERPDGSFVKIRRTPVPKGHISKLLKESQRAPSDDMFEPRDRTGTEQEGWF